MKITAEFRLGLLVKTAAVLQAQIEQNGGAYHGSMAPNFTSLFDIATMSDELLEQQLDSPLMGDVVPSDGELADLVAMWAGADPRHSASVVFDAAAIARRWAAEQERFYDELERGMPPTRQ